MAVRQIIVYWLFGCFLTACQSNLSGLYSEGLPNTASWKILPFINLTQSEGVGPRVERMLAVMLPSMGVMAPELYRDQGTHPIEIIGKPADSYSHSLKPIDDVQTQPLGFALGGEIEDWFIDEYGCPHVSLSLYVNDVSSGIRLWNDSGFKKGEAGESIYDVSRDLLAGLLTSMPVNRGGF